MDRHDYYKKFTMEELVKLSAEIEADPANKNPDHPARSIFLYAKKARKKIDEISAAIALHLEDRRAAAGRPVPVCGYSGRITKRRR